MLISLGMPAAAQIDGRSTSLAAFILPVSRRLQGALGGVRSLNVAAFALFLCSCA